MDTKRFDAENLAKHKERCDMIEQLAIVEDENRLLKSELELFRARVEQFGKLLYDTNNKILSEAERQILYMWPRFEDGEYVWFGDEYKCWCGESHTCDGVSLISNGGVIIETFERSHDATHKSGFASGEFVKRPAAKVLDADGVEIKFGDTVWDGDGVEMTVTSLVGELPGHVTTHGDNPPATYSISPKRLTHTRPDSWERLEEDASKEPCFYFGFEDKPCDDGAGCPANKLGNCSKLKASDIIRRAKALAGVEVE